MSLLLTSMNTPTAVAANGIIPLGSAVHGCGRAIRLNGNTILLNDRGYYDFNISISAAVTGDTALAAQLYVDGVAVNGAAASATPGAATDVVNLSIPWIVKKDCCCKATQITIVANSAATINDVIVSVKS